MSNKITFRALHIIWALAGLSVTLVLATATGGHPPGIVFLPVAVGIWLLGHAFLWLFHRLAMRGQRLAEVDGPDGDGWPLSLALLAFLFGGICLFGVLAMLLSSLFGGNNSQSNLLQLLLLWLPPSVCFLGIMLRQPWSRPLTSAMFIAAACFVGYLMIKSVGRPPQYHSVLAWVVSSAILLTLLFLGQHVFRSAKIRKFLAR